MFRNENERNKSRQIVVYLLVFCGGHGGCQLRLGLLGPLGELDGHFSATFGLFFMIGSILLSIDYDFFFASQNFT